MTFNGHIAGKPVYSEKPVNQTSTTAETILPSRGIEEKGSVVSRETSDIPNFR